jgi:flavin reductase (DIM6/NTAB) family NADH-FMN oxidoreductase RutF
MFKEINPKDLEMKPIEKISDEWMLISAGNKEKFNTMTASWGLVGEMWNKPVTLCAIRPQRYTLEFVENEDYYTLSFFGKGYRKELGICGSKSGRDIDKVKETGFTPIFDDKGIYFEEAEVVLFCKKLYVGEFSPEKFLDSKLCADNYPNEDYHKVFIGEIEKAFVKE